jgi:hypothetical protein
MGFMDIFQGYREINELNAWLLRYAAWCDGIEAALTEKRRVLEQ